MKRTFVFAAVILLGCACGNWAADASKKADALAKEGYWGKEDTWAEHSKLLGKSAPELNLTEWRGKGVTAAEMKDKIVVVDFWSIWFPACKRAVPRNNELARKYAGKDVVFIGACGGGKEEAMNAVAAETKMEYPTGKANEDVCKAWGVQWWPHYVVIDRKGVIRAAGIKPEYVEKVVEALVEEGK